MNTIAGTRKNVLIVCPRFAPSNAPDMHRVRLALPWLLEFGWTATVLCVEPQFVPVPQDPILMASLPPGVSIVRTSAIPLSLTRRFGVGSLTLRAFRFIRAGGDELLRRQHFDAVYFSTTEFGLFRLGPRWLSRFDVPYVLDYQDPWVTDYYRRHQLAPPGGRFKYSVAQAIARLREPDIVRKAAHITVVSPAYGEQLRCRYSLPSESLTVLPFGGASTDFELVIREGVQNPVFTPGDGYQHLLYAGVAGPYMQKSVTAILMAFRLALHRDPQRFERIRLHFVGTDYAANGQARERIRPIAEELGLSAFVHEQTERIPYLQILRCLMDADALIIPGSNDPSYTASKIFPCILAKKPLLTVFHKSSPICEIMKSCRAGVSISFDEDVNTDQLAAEIADQWFCSGGFEQYPETDWQAFEPYTARNMARRLTKVFDGAAMRACGHGTTS